ncbi:MAG: DUF6714 family protein [Nitrospiraceae bacterium]
MSKELKRNPAKALKLKEQVRSAFADVPYPGDKNIVQGSSLEAKEIESFFKGKRWEEITLESLKTNPPMDSSAGLSFMTKEAFQYYLPAYLMIAIDHKSEADVIPEFTIRALCIPEIPKPDRDRYHLRVENFTAAQRRAIKAVLEYVRELFEGLPHAKFYAPTLASIQYWSEASV